VAKKAPAVIVAAVLVVIVLAFYFVYTGDVIPNWPTLVLIGIIVVQASYALFTKTTASAVESKFTPGVSFHRDTR